MSRIYPPLAAIAVAVCLSTALASKASAQQHVVYYAPAPAVVAPAPTVVYRPVAAPVVVARPVVTPVVTYRPVAAPVVATPAPTVVYRPVAPAPVAVVAPTRTVLAPTPIVTTRYGLFGRPITRVRYGYAPVTVPAY